MPARSATGINGFIRVATAIACLLLTAVQRVQAAEPPTVQLARDQKALHPVIISQRASDATRAVAQDLASMLSQITGASFEVRTGEGNAGIVVGQPGEFDHLPFELAFDANPFERETYVLRSHASGLYLLGASDLAVSHAVWDLLHRVGYRQYFPTPEWEIVPSAPQLAVSMDDRESPSFYARRIWYNWGFWDHNRETYRRWCQRNRAVQGFVLSSGHSYGNIINQNKAEFDAHPEYFALIDGQRRTTGGDLKFCISNPSLRRLVIDHAVRFFQKNPRADSISMDPSDGGHWCECEPCAQLGSISDRALTLANEVAASINELGLGPKYVGMYAYNQHSPPPSIRVHPNVIMSATTAFIRGGYTFDQILEGWKAQGATMGVYDYLSVMAWDWNLPRGPKASRPHVVAQTLEKIHNQGVRFYDAESGDCWGPAGLGYYVASRVLWDVTQAQHVDQIIEEFLDQCFGSASEPMRAFYHLIGPDTQRRSPSDMLARMYRLLNEARSATSDPAVLKRIDHLVLYTRHAELYWAYANASGNREQAKNLVAAHAYRMRTTSMVHSYGLWARMVSQKAAATKNHPLKNDDPFTAEEISKFIADGIANHQPVETGFVSVEYSSDLVPAAAKLDLPRVEPGSYPTHPQDRQRYHVWVPEGVSSVDMKVTVEKRWNNRPHKISLFSPLAVDIKAVAEDTSVQPDGKEYAISLPTSYPGLHQVETIDGGDFTRIVWGEKLRVTIESGIDTPYVTTHFRGPWTLYFYVPRGTKVVGGWASRIANWAPRISGKLLDGDGNEVFDFGSVDEGWFKVDVPPGQDGKLWKFTNSQGQRLLMTVPPYLARTAEDLLLPTEVVTADGK